ncbi:MAG: hypothetical protein JNL83_00555 [Myxococcales bacterium]|nr:hypothetical protein [Myxococcales bacterium]
MPADDHTGKKVAIVGGAGVLAWWLLGRGEGRAFGRAPDGDEGGSRGARHVVWVRATRIELDGVPTDLPTVIAKCRESGVAEVHATGDATTRVVRDVLASLGSAGVKIYASPDVASLSPAVAP